MIQSLRVVISHPKFNHFFLYAFTMMIFGNVVAALGPLFPYLAAKEHLPETHYSSLFFFRALGFSIGALLVKVIQKYWSFHQSLFYGCIVSGAFCCLFTLTEDLNWKGIFIFASSLGGALVDTYPNVATIECFKQDNVAAWMQVLHGAFGIGGLMGSFIVYLLELKSMFLIGLAMATVGLFYLRLPSPEKKTQSRLLDDSQPTEKPQYISRKTNYLMAINFYFLVGQYSTYGGWAASYSVLKGFSTKEHATFYTSLFWISITVFRFVFAFVGGKASSKVYLLTTTAMLQSLFSLFLINKVDANIGMIITSLVFGLSNSVLFPLLLVIPKEYGLNVSPGQNSTFLVFASLGEGTLAVIVGELMKNISYDCFMISMGGMNFAAICMIFFIIRSLKSDSQPFKDVQLDNIHEKNQYD